jgi:hypothetical protein
MEIKFDTGLAAQKAEFLEKVTGVAKKLDCRGKVQGKQMLTDDNIGQVLNLDVILRLGIMMQDPKEVALALELGADPERKIKNKTALQIAQAYRNKKIIKIIEDYTPKAKKRPSPKKL